MWRSVLGDLKGGGNEPGCGWRRGGLLRNVRPWGRTRVIWDWLLWWMSVEDGEMGEWRGGEKESCVAVITLEIDVFC